MTRLHIFMDAKNTLRTPRCTIQGDNALQSNPFRTRAACPHILMECYRLTQSLLEQMATLTSYNCIHAYNKTVKTVPILDRDHSTSDTKVLPTDPACCRQKKEKNRAGHLRGERVSMRGIESAIPVACCTHVLRLPKALLGVQTRHLVKYLLRLALEEEFGRDRPRRDDVDSYSPFRSGKRRVAREHACHLLDGTFGCDVRQVARRDSERVRGERRAREDEASIRADVRRERLREKERPGYVRLYADVSVCSGQPAGVAALTEVVVVVRLRHLGQRLHGHDAGIVHEGVELAAQRSERGLRECMCACLVEDRTSHGVQRDAMAVFFLDRLDEGVRA
jgi:hypothetical protein